MNVTTLAAKRRGWEGPYRFRYRHTTGTHIYEYYAVGWIVLRGRRLLHFFSNTDGKMLKVPLEDERHMKLLSESAAENHDYRLRVLNTMLDKAMARNDEDEMAKLDLEIRSFNR